MDIDGRVGVSMIGVSTTDRLVLRGDTSTSIPPYCGHLYRSVNGHWSLPRCGHEMCPVAASGLARSRPAKLPSSEVLCAMDHLLFLEFGVPQAHGVRGFGGEGARPAFPQGWRPGSTYSGSRSRTATGSSHAGHSPP